MGNLITTRHCVVYDETPESRTQVDMLEEGLVKVHDNVVFEANTAGDSGGAVSLPFAPFSFLSALVSCDIISKTWFDPLRQLIKPRRKGWWLSSNHSNVVFEANTAGSCLGRGEPPI